MEIEIIEKRENPLLDRTDVRFVAHHAGDKTPTRDQLRKSVASAVGAKAELTIIDSVRSEYGRGASQGFAKVYTSVEKARHHERHYIQKRNNIFVEAKKEGGD
jgi:small subunit ribosomal protein S24e